MTMNRVIHAAVRRDLQRLSTALDDWRNGDRAHGGELERAFGYLRAELTHHHESEDTHVWPMLASVGVDRELLETMLAPHHDSPAWKAVEKKLRSRPIGETGRFFAWLTDGMAEPERQFLRSTVPPPVVYVLSRGFGRDYRREVAPLWR